MGCEDRGRTAEDYAEEARAEKLAKERLQDRREARAIQLMNALDSKDIKAVVEALTGIRHGWESLW